MFEHFYDHRASYAGTLLVVIIFLVSCSSTSPSPSVPNNPSRPPSGDLTVQLFQDAATPLQVVRARVLYPDGTVVNPADVVLATRFEGTSETGYFWIRPTTNNEFTFRAPLGVINPQTLAMESGTVHLFAYLRSDPERVPNQTTALNINMLRLPEAMPGELSKAYLWAFKATHLNALRNFQLLQSRASSLNQSELPNVIQYHSNQVQFFDQLIADVDRAQSGQTVTMGNVNGVPTTLTLDSLRLLDSYLVAMFGVVPRQVTSGSIDSLQLSFEVPDLGAIWRQEGERIGTAVAYAATGIVIGGALLGSTPVITAGLALGALGFLGGTVLPGVIGLVNDTASSAIVNGKATFEDFRASTRHFFEHGFAQWTAPFVLPATGPIAGEVLGRLYEGAVRGSIQIVDKAGTLMEDVQKAYDNGTIPASGFIRLCQNVPPGSICVVQ